LLLPPKHISSDRLFRLLIARPRPTWPLEYRAPFAPNVALHVQALRGTEELSALDGAYGCSRTDPKWRDAMSRLVSLALYTPEGRAFSSVADMDLILDEEFFALTRAVSVGLGVVSPTYYSSDHHQWDQVLQKGARHFTNAAEMYLLGGCETAREYYGTPLADLTDGQLMAYRAARRIVINEQERSTR
jgi:hypothetical protein